MLRAVCSRGGRQQCKADWFPGSAFDVLQMLQTDNAKHLCLQARAVKQLLAHRLDSHEAAAARREWHDLVEGQHRLWAGVSDPYKHTIRAFLVHFHSAILRHASERFNFLNGSVGEPGCQFHSYHRLQLISGFYYLLHVDVNGAPPAQMVCGELLTVACLVGAHSCIHALVHSRSWDSDVMSSARVAAPA